MSIAVDIDGARRNVGAALAIDERLVVAWQEDSIAGARGIGSIDGGLPTRSVKTVLALGRASASNVSSQALKLPHRLRSSRAVFR